MSDDRRGSDDSDMSGDSDLSGGSRRAWHVPEEDLRAYAQGELAPPHMWSADTHLAACPRCRETLAALSDPVALDAGWERLDAELDAPGRDRSSGCSSGSASPTTRRGCWPPPPSCAAPGSARSSPCWA